MIALLLIMSFLVTFDFPECFGDKFLDGLVTLNNEAHGGELAAAVAEQLVRQTVRELFLESHRLKPGERGADTQVQLL